MSAEETRAGQTALAYWAHGKLLYSPGGQKQRWRYNLLLSPQNAVQDVSSEKHYIWEILVHIFILLFKYSKASAFNIVRNRANPISVEWTHALSNNIHWVRYGIDVLIWYMDFWCLPHLFVPNSRCYLPMLSVWMAHDWFVLGTGLQFWSSWWVLELRTILNAHKRCITIHHWNGWHKGLLSSKASLLLLGQCANCRAYSPGIRT